MAMTEPELSQLLKKSLVDDDMKNSLRKQLPKLNKEQKTKLLEILQKEQEMLGEEVAKKNAPIYAKLLEEMNDLLHEHLNNARKKIETQDKQNKKAKLSALEQELDNL